MLYDILYIEKSFSHFLLRFLLTAISQQAYIHELEQNKALPLIQSSYSELMRSGPNTMRNIFFSHRREDLEALSYS